MVPTLLVNDFASADAMLSDASRQVNEQTMTTELFLMSLDAPRVAATTRRATRLPQDESPRIHRRFKREDRNGAVAFSFALSNWSEPHCRDAKPSRPQRGARPGRIAARLSPR